MRLSRKQIDHAVKAIVDTCSSDKVQCSHCGTKPAIIKSLMSVRSYAPPVSGGTSEANPIDVPLVALFCSKCGRMEFFSAIKLGLLENNGAVVEL